MATTQSHRPTFTTREESRMLLDIGLPTFTADCYHDPFGQVQKIPDGYTFDILHNKGLAVTPCWSAGQLMQIHCDLKGSMTDYVIHAFPTNIMNEVFHQFYQAVTYRFINFKNLEA